MTEREAANGLMELQQEGLKNIKAWSARQSMKNMGIGNPTAEEEVRNAMLDTERKILRLMTRIRLETIRIRPTEFPQAAEYLRRAKTLYEKRVDCFAFNDLETWAYRTEDGKIFSMNFPPNRMG